MKVLLGHFTFLEPTPIRALLLHRSAFPKTENSEGSYTAIVHTIDKIVEVPYENLDEFCEAALEHHEGYLIPELYNGKIVYE